MYRIKTGQREAAKRLGVVIRPSTSKNKKLDVFKNGFKVASIGDLRYKDYWEYVQEEQKGIVPQGTAKTRRELYKVRHAADRWQVGTPGFYADKILW